MRLTTATLAAKWWEVVSQVLLVLVLPRALGPAPYGEFAVAFAAVTLLSVSLGLGAPLAAVRFVPALAPGEQLPATRTVLRRVAASRATVLLTVTVAAAALVPTLLHVPLWITLVVCLAAWWSVASSVASEISLALSRTLAWNLRFPVENTLIVAVVPIGAAVDGAHGALTAMALACVATFGVLYSGLTRDLAAARSGAALPPGATGYARVETLVVILSTVVLRGGTLAVGLARTGRAQTGFAALALGAGAAGAGAMMELLSVHLPGWVPRYGTGTASSREEPLRAARLALAVAVGASLLAAVLARPAIHVLLGSAFVAARHPLVLALPTAPLGAVLALAGVRTSLDLRPRLLALSWGAAAVTFVITAAIAVPLMHADGAALAMSSGMLAGALTSVVVIGGRELMEICVLAIVGAALVLAAGWAVG